MKIKLYIFLPLVFLFSSCKKNYECECKITTYLAAGWVMADGSTSYTKTKVTEYENSTRRKAKSLCKSYTSWPQTGEKIEAECKLLK